MKIFFGIVMAICGWFAVAAVEFAILDAVFVIKSEIAAYGLCMFTSIGVPFTVFKWLS